MAAMNKGQFLVPAVIVVALVSVNNLAAQGSARWIQVELEDDSKTKIKVLILKDPDGCQVFFKNFGMTTVQFGFYIEGLQTEDAIPANGRIHLKPGNQSGAVIIRRDDSAHGPIRLRSVEAVVGEVDAPTTSSKTF